MIKSTDTLAIFMEDALNSDYGKMGLGVLRYSQNKICCVIDSTHEGQSLSEITGIDKNIPIVSDIGEAKKKGANVLILGTAPSGGRLPHEWLVEIEKAIASGMSIVNGLHDTLKDRYDNTLVSTDQWIWDIRVPAFIPEVGTAKAAKLNNKRLLLIGTDMAVGKMTTGLELQKYLVEAGKDVGFVATGQIGITITGQGIPLDAFIVDRAAGAVEHATLVHSNKEIIIIEGQGSLLHPGSTATLPLMRGSCPTHLILCMRGDKKNLRKPEHIKIPDLKDFIKLNEDLAKVCGSLTKAITVGISVNTSKLSEEDAKVLIEQIEQDTGLPTTDVIRYGCSKIGDPLL